MGGSFGNYTMGNDEEVMPITSANIAGGYHAGDPHVMRETAALASDHDVGVGIHPGLPDMMGFGRRQVDASPREVRDYVVYHLGALRAFADEHGYPVGIKTDGGGGGHGMRVVEADVDVDAEFEEARREAEAYPDNPDVYVERFLDNPKHIEAQILADEHGNVRHLGERDYSTQRRQQKLTEETPSPALGPEERAALYERAQ
jgi:hypothetical protein